MANNPNDSELDKQPAQDIPTISLFEATRQFRRTNLNLQQLSKTIRILRKRQEQYGRTNKLYQEELIKLVDTKFRPQSKPPHDSPTSNRQTSAQTQAPSLHLERPSNTRQTSHRLRRALQEVRQFEARSVRDNTEMNEKRLKQRQMAEIEAKRKKRDDILGFEKALRESYTDFRKRRQLKTKQEKRRDISQLLNRRKQNEKVIQDLLDEKENLMECMNQGSKLQVNLRLTLKKVSQTKPLPGFKLILNQEQTQC